MSSAVGLAIPTPATGAISSDAVPARTSPITVLPTAAALSAVRLPTPAVGSSDPPAVNSDSAPASTSPYSAERRRTISFLASASACAFSSISLSAAAFDSARAAFRCAELLAPELTGALLAVSPGSDAASVLAADSADKSISPSASVAFSSPLSVALFGWAISAFGAGNVSAATALAAATSALISAATSLAAATSAFISAAACAARTRVSSAFSAANFSTASALDSASRRAASFSLCFTAASSASLAASAFSCSFKTLAASAALCALSPRSASSDWRAACFAAASA